jgi:hypothetical protein
MLDRLVVCQVWLAGCVLGSGALVAVHSRRYCGAERGE